MLPIILEPSRCYL